MSLSAEVHGIPSREAVDYWPLALPLLAPAIARTGGRFTPADILAAISRAEMQLWLVTLDEKPAGAVVTEIVCYPQKKFCRVFLLGGTHTRRWLHLEQRIAEWAKAQGCAGMETMGRAGWRRLLKGYSGEFTILERTF